MTDESVDYDLVVIGAGINGAGIARDAATRGLRVLLLEKADIGGGTSSWSSRLIHGGLRYLEYGEIPLVFESLRERVQRNGIDDGEVAQRYAQMALSLKQISSGPMASASRFLAEVRHHRVNTAPLSASR